MVRRTPDAGTRFIEGAFSRAGKHWAWPPYVMLDPGDDMVSCEIALSSPAPEVGLWVIRCRRCEFYAAVTAKGTGSDPKRVWLPCKVVPRRDLAEAEDVNRMLENMAETVNEALTRSQHTVNPYDAAYRAETKEVTETHARRLRLALDLPPRHEPTILKAMLAFIADMTTRFRRSKGE